MTFVDPKNEERIWKAWTAWIKDEYIEVGTSLRFSDLFRAGYLAAEADAEARRVQEHGEIMP
jgi:hypothetical protein